MNFLEFQNFYNWKTDLGLVKNDKKNIIAKDENITYLVIKVFKAEEKKGKQKCGISCFNVYTSKKNYFKS